MYLCMYACMYMYVCICECLSFAARLVVGLIVVVFCVLCGLPTMLFFRWLIRITCMKIYCHHRFISKGCWLIDGHTRRHRVFDFLR